MNKATACRDASGKYITGIQAQHRYNLSKGVVMRLASEADALVKFGKSIRYNVEKMDAFLEQQCSVR